MSDNSKLPDVTNDKLPPDLKAAQDEAIYLAGAADGVWSIMSMSGKMSDDELLNFAGLVKELKNRQPACHAAIHAVAVELRQTRRGNPVRFGDIVAASAHEAAIEMEHAVERAVWEKTLSLKTLREHFAKKKTNWPDAREVTATIRLEAAEAAKNRQTVPPPKSGTRSADSTATLAEQTDPANIGELFARKAKEAAALENAERKKNELMEKGRSRQHALFQALNGLDVATGMIDGKESAQTEIVSRLLAAGKLKWPDGQPLSAYFDVWDSDTDWWRVAKAILGAAENNNARAVENYLGALGDLSPWEQSQVWRSMAQLLDAPLPLPPTDSRSAKQKLRDAVRHEHLALGMLRDLPTKEADWTMGVKELWDLWRRELMETVAPPPRPTPTDYHSARDALDSFQRAVEELPEADALPTPTEMPLMDNRAIDEKCLTCGTPFPPYESDICRKCKAYLFRCNPWPRHKVGAVVIEDVDFAAILALAEPLPLEAMRLASWTQDGPLDETGASILLKIADQWLAVETTLEANGLAGRPKRWVAGNSSDHLLNAATCLSDLANAIRKKTSWLHYIGCCHTDFIDLVPDACLGMPHSVFAKRITIAVEMLRAVVGADTENAFSPHECIAGYLRELTEQCLRIGKPFGKGGRPEKTDVSTLPSGPQVQEFLDKSNRMFVQGVAHARLLPDQPQRQWIERLHSAQVQHITVLRAVRTALDAGDALELDDYLPWHIETLQELASEAAQILVKRPTPSDPPPAEPTATARRLKGIPRDEAEIRVRDWLAANARDDPAAITRDAVVLGTGVSAGQVSNTAAWKAFRDRRNAEAKPVVREVPLTDPMQASIPSDCGRPDELAALIEDQKADEAEQERHHNRRHGPS